MIGTHPIIYATYPPVYKVVGYAPSFIVSGILFLKLSIFYKFLKIMRTSNKLKQ